MDQEFPQWLRRFVWSKQKVRPLREDSITLSRQDLAVLDKRIRIEENGVIPEERRVDAWFVGGPLHGTCLERDAAPPFFEWEVKPTDLAAWKSDNGQKDATLYRLHEDRGGTIIYRADGIRHRHAQGHVGHFDRQGVWLSIDHKFCPHGGSERFCPHCKSVAVAVT